MNFRTPHGAPRRLPSLAIAIAMALPATAALAQDSGWYLGLSAGASSADVQTTDLAFSLRDGGFSPTALDSDDTDIAFRLLGGYDFNQYFAIEASYFNLGDFKYNATLFPAGSHHGKASIDGFALDLVGKVPVFDRLSAFARLGLNYSDVDKTFVDTAIPARFPNRHDRGINEKYGIGLEYRLNDAFSLRAELERYRVDKNRVIDDRVDALTAGFIYRFGRTSAPVAVAPEPAPAPITTPTPPPPPPEPVEFTFSADTMFDFDSAALRAGGQQELDGLLQELEGMDIEVVIVTGHTDRIGTREYNLDLSERRANTVRDYLVANGIPGNRITARGVNSDEPVTAPGQCVNTGSAQAQIACLQPDRRVVVEVTGLREPE